MMNENEGDLEEGELSSEGDQQDEDGQVIREDELQSVDYTVLPRPMKATSTTPNSTVGEFKKVCSSGPGCSRTIGVDPIYQNIARPTRPSPVPGFQMLADEDDDGLYDNSSSSEDDSDDEDGPSGRKCRRMPNTGFMNPGAARSTTVMTNNNNNVPSSGSNFPVVDGVVAATSSASCDTPMESNDIFKNHAAVFQEKRKPNNIWSTVLQEEEVSNIMGKVNVEEYNDQHVLIDRGPETFAVKYKHRIPIRQKSDSSTVSSGGLTDDELEYLRGTAFQNQGESVRMDEGVDDDGLVGQFGRRRIKRNYNQKSYGYKRRQKRKRKNRVVNKMKRMDCDALGYYISGKLEEPKHNLIINSIELLGREAVISLFLKTTKIERRGGLMVKNQERRRTAGGVFFYLLRGDRKFPRKIVDKIFATDVLNQRICRKREHKEARIKRLAVLADKKKIQEQRHKEDAGGEYTETAHQPNYDDKESSLSEGEDVDSDEFCGRQEPQPVPNPPPTEMRSMVEYEDDCLDIHCDASDLM